MQEKGKESGEIYFAAMTEPKHMGDVGQTIDMNGISRWENHDSVISTAAVHNNATNMKLSNGGFMIKDGVKYDRIQTDKFPVVYKTKGAPNTIPLKGTEAVESGYVMMSKQNKFKVVNKTTKTESGRFGEVTYTLVELQPL